MTATFWIYKKDIETEKISEENLEQTLWEQGR